MLSLDQFSGFLIVAMLVTLSPGPDNLMVLGFGMARGRAQGVVFGIGCAIGCLSHTVLATLGVSALIAASPTAFLALKICGGLYLLRLGILALRNPGRVQLAQDDKPPESLRRLFVRGLVANAINPKVILFFLSFLPQFVSAGRGHVAWQTAQLGLVFTVQAALLFGLLGFFSGALGHWLKRNERAGQWMDRLAGMIFVGLGVRLLFLK